MLLCCRDEAPFHITTVAREVFDVSGAGDTVVACFTLALAAGASPHEAAILSNHAAGMVVGKVGTATVTREELLASLAGEKALSTYLDGRGGRQRHREVKYRSTPIRRRKRVGHPKAQPASR